MQSAELASGADVRLLSWVESAHGRGPALEPRPAHLRCFGEQQGVRNSVFDVGERGVTVVAEDTGPGVALGQSRRIGSDVADNADVGRGLRLQPAADWAASGHVHTPIRLVATLLLAPMWFQDSP